MMPTKSLCPNCGQNPDDMFYECIECYNQLCENCVNICRNCGQPLCDAHFRDHKRKCN